MVLLILDPSAAFDTADHTKLLQILYSQFHISGNALKWLKAFLSGRSQRVKVGNVSSDSLDILFGVPQGSILGPLLFNLFLNLFLTLVLTALDTPTITLVTGPFQHSAVFLHFLTHFLDAYLQLTAGLPHTS